MVKGETWLEKDARKKIEAKNKLHEEHWRDRFDMVLEFIVYLKINGNSLDGWNDDYNYNQAIHLAIRFPKYFSEEFHHSLTGTLCAVITNMSESLKKSIIYCESPATARKLADWWDEHKIWDRARTDVEII